MTAQREISARHASAAGNSPEFLTTSKLRARGWTDGLIRRMLGSPDDYAANVSYPGGAPVRLYATDRIERIETSAEFKAAKETADKRRGATVKAGETKRQTALTWIEQLDGPKLPAAPRVEIERLAVNWTNQTFGWRGDCERWLSGQEAAEYLATITIDYVIAQLHGFEHKLRAALGKSIAASDLELIRAKTLNAIAAAYPWLALECARRKTGKVNQ